MGTRAYGDILSEIHPANHAIGIKEKFGRARYIRSFWSGTGVQHVIPANDFCSGVGKQREGVTEFLGLPAIDLGRIETDADHANPVRIEIRKLLLETPQLGVAEWSPKAAIKNQHNSI